MNSEINFVDLCFVVDTTGSMGSFINAAKKQLVDTIRLLSADNDINLQVGLVEYRDHPPQDTSFVTHIYPLTANLKQMQKSINRLEASGGGDEAEAVYQGVYDGCEKMPWRNHSYRFVMLVGDSPPHGFAALWEEMTGQKGLSANDSWPQGCPSGLDVRSVSATAENQRVTVFGLCMSNSQATLEAFRAIARFTGGDCVAVTDTSQVIAQMQGVLSREFGNVAFDREVLERVQQMGSEDVEAIASSLDCSSFSVATSVARLGKRGFF